MTANEVKAKCESLAQQLSDAASELQALIPSLPLHADERAAEEAVMHLGWASATCTMIGVHASKQARDEEAGSA